MQTDNNAPQEERYEDAANYQLLPDDDFEDDETLDHTTLFHDMKSGLEQVIAWERGEGALRTTLYTEDGQRAAPEMMTKAQFEARTGDVETVSDAVPETDPYRLIGELLQWAGRDAATSEQALEIQRLRLRAHAVLQAANAK